AGLPAWLGCPLAAARRQRAPIGLRPGQRPRGWNAKNTLRIGAYRCMLKAHGAVHLHYRRRGLFARQRAGFIGSWGCSSGTRLFGSAEEARPLSQCRPGTMSPYQHGEVFVTDDGAETDLDLGHYERFTGVPARKSDNITTGRIYQEILAKERRG